MAAAHTAPVGAYCKAFTVINERTTSSRHSPWYVHWATQSAQYCLVASKAADASSGRVASSRAEYQAIEKPSRSPSLTVNSAVVVMWLPCTGTGLWKRRPSLPATSVSPSPVDCAHGTIDP